MMSLRLCFFERMYQNVLYYELKENVFKIETLKKFKSIMRKLN
jgi:hypothetical protein